MVGVEETLHCLSSLSLSLNARGVFLGWLVASGVRGLLLESVFQRGKRVLLATKKNDGENGSTGVERGGPDASTSAGYGGLGHPLEKKTTIQRSVAL